MSRDTYCFLGNNRAVALMHDGHRIYVDTRDRGITPHLALYGEWERAIEDVLGVYVQPGHTVIEVGSNFGYHTLHMAANVGPTGKVIAFEANRHVFDLLKDSVDLNGYADRVNLVNQAAWSENGTKYLIANPDWVGGGYVADEKPADDLAGEMDAFKVLTSKLDDIAVSADIIRIDAEGSEMEILAGAKSLIRNSPNLRIVMEWSVGMMSRLSDVPTSIEWLAGEGFGFWRINGDRTFTHVPTADLLALPHCEMLLVR